MDLNQNENISTTKGLTKYKQWALLYLNTGTNILLTHCKT